MFPRIFAFGLCSNRMPPINIQGENLDLILNLYDFVCKNAAIAYLWLNIKTLINLKIKLYLLSNESYMTKRKHLLILLMSLFSVSFVKAQESPTVPPPPPPPPPNTVVSIYGINGNNHGSYPSKSRSQTNSDKGGYYLRRQRKRKCLS